MNQLKNITTAILLFFSAFGLNAQGIEFEHGKLAEVMALAKKENKIIFVDCLTDWCGPCKWMSANTFTDPEVGTFYNENFVNYKLDMEKGEGIDFAKKYSVRAYPTLLFIDAKGELVHLGLGTKTAEDFIKLGEVALNPELNLRGLEARYNDGEKSAEFLGTYLKLLNTSGKDVSKAMEDWKLQVQPQDLTNEFNWSVYEELMSDSQNEYFTYILNNYDDLAIALGEEKVNGKVLSTYRTELITAIRNGDSEEVDEVKATIQKSGIKGAEKMMLVTELSFAGFQKDWELYKQLSETIAEKHAADDWEVLNTIAWKYFEEIEDKSDLKKATSWAKKSVEIEAHYYNLDTFGMLLLKLGEKEDAKKQLRLAIKTAREEGLDPAETEKVLSEIK